jgi:site-specific recombinase XerC
MHATIGEFVTDLRLAGRTARTIEGHELELKRLARWVEQEGIDWQQLDKRKLQQYTRLRADLGFSSRNNMLCSLRVFFRWAVEQSYMAMSPAAGFKTPTRPKPLPRALTVDQVRRLIAFLNTQEGRTARRDEALIYTALYAGLRAAELAALQWAAIDFAGGVINIKLSKMGRGRSIPLHPELCSLLANWRTIQALGDQVPVFSLDGQPLAPARPGKICKRIRLESGVPFTTHALRHTFATQTLRRSGNLYAVSKALGHSQVQQTEIYLVADIESTRGAVETLPSLANW